MIINNFNITKGDWKYGLCFKPKEMITNTEKEQKIFKLTLEELNKAYEEVKELGEASQRDRVKTVIARDPLTIHNLKILLKEDNFPIVFSLEFIFDYNIGIKGRWILDTKVNEVIVVDIDE